MTYFGHFFDKFLGRAGSCDCGGRCFRRARNNKVPRHIYLYHPSQQAYRESTKTKWLFNNNYLYNLLVSSFNVKGIIDNILSKITSLTGTNKEEK
jgi:hypothetical protein